MVLHAKKCICLMTEEDWTEDNEVVAVMPEKETDFAEWLQNVSKVLAKLNSGINPELCNALYTAYKAGADPTIAAVDASLRKLW